MKLATISPDLRKKYNIGATLQGVVVMAVEPNSAAAEKRIEPGDVITEADQREARSPTEIAERAKDLEERGKNSILLLISKSSENGELRFIALKIKS
jgi:serine protease Do